MGHNYLEKTVDYKQIKIQYDDLGSDKAVVLLHGFLEDRSIWKDLIEDLKHAYRVINIDLPGHGGSGIFGEVHSMEEMARAVRSVLNKQKVKKAVIAGHSMGGYVALAFAELYPEMVQAIALINSTPFPDNETKKINRDRAAEAVRHNKRNFIGLTIPSLFSEAHRTTYSKEIEELKTKAGEMPVGGITAALMGMKDRPDRSHIMLSGKIPCLLIIGKEDAVVSPDSLVTLSGIDHVKVVELEGGHMSYLESKDDFSYFFMHFIENL